MTLKEYIDALFGDPVNISRGFYRGHSGTLYEKHNLSFQIKIDKLGIITTPIHIDNLELCKTNSNLPTSVKE